MNLLVINSAYIFKHCTKVYEIINKPIMFYPVLVKVDAGLPPMSILRRMFPEMSDSSLKALTPPEVETKRDAIIVENSGILGDVLVTTTTVGKSINRMNTINTTSRQLKNQQLKQLEMIPTRH